MIITQSHDVKSAKIQSPMVGAGKASRHMSSHRRVFHHFVSSLSPVDHGSEEAIAITVECDNVSASGLEAAMSRTSERYFFVMGLHDRWRREHLREAVSRGILPPLASIQLFVRQINQLGKPCDRSTVWNLPAMMNKIDADAETVAKIISDVVARSAERC